MNHLEAKQLQRLIDGELEPDSVQMMLRQAQQQPQLWQEIALGFVEDMTWRRAFGDQLNREAAESSPQSEPGTEETRQLGAKGLATTQSAFRWLSLAAAALIAVSIGFVAGNNFQSTQMNSNVANHEGAVPTNIDKIANQSTLGNQNPIDSSLDSVATTPVAYDPDFHFQLTDAHGNPVMNSDIPMYGRKNAERMGLFDRRQLPESFLRKVSDSGYGVLQDTNYMSGQLNDGRRFVVPIRTINLSPGL